MIEKISSDFLSIYLDKGSDALKFTRVTISRILYLAQFDWADGNHLSRIAIARDLKRLFLALHRIGVFHGACHQAVPRELLPHDFNLTSAFGGSAVYFLLHCPWASKLMFD